MQLRNMNLLVEAILVGWILFLGIVIRLLFGHPLFFRQTTAFGFQRPGALRQPRLQTARSADQSARLGALQRRESAEIGIGGAVGRLRRKRRHPLLVRVEALESELDASGLRVSLPVRVALIRVGTVLRVSGRLFRRDARR